jgi:hypothetical protein
LGVSNNIGRFLSEGDGDMLAGFRVSPDANLRSLLQDHVVADDRRQAHFAVRAISNDEKREQHNQSVKSLLHDRAEGELIVY